MMTTRLVIPIALRVAVLAMLSSAMSVACPPLSQAQTSQAAITTEATPLIATLITLHNRQRTQAGLAALTVDARLMQAAQVQAQYMAEYNKTTHQGRDGTTPTQRVEQQGYHAVRVAENVADGPETSEAVLQAWMHSPPHRQNILGPFAEIGAARATNTEGHPYWCVVFGAPFPALDPGRASAAVLRLLNQQRDAARLPPLAVAPPLSEVAQTQARAMATHTAQQGQNGNGSALLKRLQRAGYRYRKISQGAVSGAPTPDAVVQGLMDNSTYKQRVLGDFTQIGIGYATAADGTPYWTILFAIPRR